MNTVRSLEGRRFLVTGGTRGIGRAITLHLARAGARVAANYVRDIPSAESLMAAGSAENLAIDVIRADIASDKGVDRLLGGLDTDYASLSGFIHCAATGVHRPVEKLTLREFDWTFALNVRAFFELVHRLLPRFEPDASIVALSSEGAVRAVPQYTLVGSSKGALEAMMRHLAVELAPRGIRVNAISPGSVRTDAWKALPDAEQRLEEATRRTPRGRLVTPDEVAQVALFLCSPSSGGIVGQTLVVDGGYRVRE